MDKRTVWQSPSGHMRVDQFENGTLYQVTKDLSSNMIIHTIKIDAERLEDLMKDRPSRSGWQDRAK